MHNAILNDALKFEYQKISKHYATLDPGTLEWERDRKKMARISELLNGATLSLEYDQEILSDGLGLEQQFLSMQVSRTEIGTIERERAQSVLNTCNAMIEQYCGEKLEMGMNR